MDRYEYSALESSMNLGLDIAEEGLFSKVKEKMKSMKDRRKDKNQYTTYEVREDRYLVTENDYKILYKVCGNITAPINPSKPEDALVKDIRTIFKKLVSHSDIKNGLFDQLRHMIAQFGKEDVQEYYFGGEEPKVESIIREYSFKVDKHSDGDVDIWFGEEMEQDMNIYFTTPIIELIIRILKDNGKYENYFVFSFGDGDEGGLFAGRKH